jgi:hypothetical protein
VNALANGAVGRYVGAHFVSSFQKVATFKIVRGAKQGGNVASYFCTPAGEVVHAIAGPVDAATFLREARWAVETFKLAQLEASGSPARLRAFLHDAHAERLRREHGYDLGTGAGKLPVSGRVHLLLAAAPLVKVEGAYKLVFEKFLGETVSAAPVAETR